MLDTYRYGDNGKYKINSKNIEIDFDSRFLEHSASLRDKTDLVLNQRQLLIPDRKIFCIDGSLFTSNIQEITDINFSEFDTLLPGGIDGIIANTSKKIELILPVADCGAILLYDNSGEIIGAIHAGYKGVAGNGDLGIVVNTIDILKKVKNSENLKDMNFFIGPMMGSKFELPIEYVEKLFNDLFRELKFKKENYFLKHDTDNKKCYLNLRRIIKDIFKVYGNINIKMRGEGTSVFMSDVTNKKNSEYPSFRVYTNYKDVLNSVISIDNDLKNNGVHYTRDEIIYLKNKRAELIEGFSNSDGIYKLKFDYRLAGIIRN